MTIELDWIRKEDKSLLNPTVVFSSINLVSGYYLHPKLNEVLIDEKFYSRKNGIIVINTYADFGSIIAHEWRHHWQFCNGWQYDGVAWMQSDNYKKNIRDYFLSSKSEMDAFLFEHKKAKSELNDYQYGLLQNKKL